MTLEEEKLERLLSAVRKGDLLKVQMIISDNVTDLNLKTEGGWTPLMFATSLGHTAIVQALVSAGADTWLLNRQNQDAMYIARKKGFDDVVAILKQGVSNDSISSVHAHGGHHG